MKMSIHRLLPRVGVHFVPLPPTAAVVALGALLASLLATTAYGQFHYAVLHSFSGNSADGASSGAALLEASDGALYGTTDHGGTNDVGTVFKISKDGSGYAVLYNFTGPDYDPKVSALAEGSDGALYGTARNGGAAGGDMIFRLQEDGGFTVLHSFTNESDGARPEAALAQGSDGALYGTTSSGGTNRGGTVFKLNLDGSGYEILHRFEVPNRPTPTGPGAPLLEGSDGTFYGTTYGAWISIYSPDRGTVFRLNRDGSGFVVLHDFNGSADDGRHPGALVECSDGKLYGTTRHGGLTNGYYELGMGTVFRLNKDGSSYEVLRRFTFADGDGQIPAGLVQGNDGALYGTTVEGGAGGPGILFRLNRDGSGFTVVHSFSVTEGDGQNARVAPLQGSDGAFYGTTYSGGEVGAGTVFALRPKPTMLPLTFTGDGVTVRFTSMPSSTHRLQRASTLDGSWLTLTNLVVPRNGLVEFTDRALLQSGAFYRTMSP
jgi:uncharacterized repeat protein (TIGR03803 family)